MHSLWIITADIYVNKIILNIDECYIGDGFVGNMIVLDRDDSKLTKKQSDIYLKMSNGATAMFLETLVLSGSRIAKTSKEKELIIWFSEHDQDILGIGTAGFSLSEIPFDYVNFDKEKDFLLKVINGVNQHLGWNTLDYLPNQEILDELIKTFREMLLLFDINLIDKLTYYNWKTEHFGRSYINKEYYEKEYAPHIDWMKAKNMVTNDTYELWKAECNRYHDKAEKLFIEFPICNKHFILKSIYGCIICKS